MNSRDLGQRVTLQAPSTTQDELGQPLTGWTDVATVWADVRYLSGLGAIKAGADTSVGKVSIRLRYRAVNAGQRIVCGNEVFDVQTILPDGKKTYVDLVCQVINADT
jgi:SPP1 family predicted phage head-tail adaptor